jgi:hypothetical protein
MNIFINFLGIRLGWKWIHSYCKKHGQHVQSRLLSFIRAINLYASSALPTNFHIRDEFFLDIAEAFKFSNFRWIN